MITIIGMTKNSADVIEQFIRGNGLYADNFVLINNASTDDTLDIIKNLIAEGYKIDVFDDNEVAFLQGQKTNYLLQWVRDKYNPDWIVPLDDDEILTSIDGSDVREKIAQLDDDKIYHIKWRNYIPTEEDDDNELCIMKRQTICFADKFDSYYKVLIPKKWANDPKLAIAPGNHDAIGTDAPKAILNSLRIAHYPVRSKNQIISKALVGWTNYLAEPNRHPNVGHHWKKIYDMVKSGEEITIDSMWAICMTYMKNMTAGSIEVACEPIKIDAKAFETKYASANEVDPLINYINNAERIAQAYAKLLENATNQ